jgi:pimeloyl-ACP methyl ester carboxylesterase
MVAVGLHDGGGEMTRTVNGFPVTRTLAATAAAPTLLLIHGFLDDASIWEGLVDCLGGEVGTVRYDLPGFGARSGSVEAARGATLESLAAEAGEIVEGIDGPVIVVGQSLGTQIAELVAARHQDRVRGLVLLTPVPLGGTQLPDEVVAPFGALGGNRVAQRSLRGELSPNLSEEQLDRGSRRRLALRQRLEQRGEQPARDECIRRPSPRHRRRRGRVRDRAGRQCRQSSFCRRRRQSH